MCLSSRARMSMALLAGAQRADSPRCSSSAVVSAPPLFRAEARLSVEEAIDAAPPFWRQCAIRLQPAA